MHNKVVHRLAEDCVDAGSVVLRFNFRGVNLSEGSYDIGRGEVDDARRGARVSRERYPDLPYALAGFSFGSRNSAPRVRAAGSAAGKADRGRLPHYSGTLDEILADSCDLPKYFVAEHQ